jgi:hypothetical protein
MMEQTTMEAAVMMMEQTTMEAAVMGKRKMKEKATEDQTSQMNFRGAQLLADETLVTSAADTLASADFFIIDRHVMKIQ